MDPSKPIVELTNYYKIDEMPLRFERKLQNCNITILIYSFIENKGLFEKVYNLIYNGMEILNDYLNFGNEMYRDKEVKWKIYIQIVKEYPKNNRIKWKKEKDKKFDYIHSLLELQEDENSWQKKIVSGWLVYQIHELSHYYFYFWHMKRGIRSSNFYSWFDEGFSVYLEYIIRDTYFKEKGKWHFEQFERVKKDKELYKEVWDYVGGRLARKHQRKILIKKLTFTSNKNLKEYIYNFWKHFDDLYFLSGAIVMTMEEYYGKDKFKEILKMYRDGIEKEKLKKIAEEAIKAKW